MNNGREIEALEENDEKQKMDEQKVIICKEGEQEIHESKDNQIPSPQGTTMKEVEEEEEAIDESQELLEQKTEPVDLLEEKNYEETVLSPVDTVNIEELEHLDKEAAKSVEIIDRLIEVIRPESIPETHEDHLQEESVNSLENEPKQQPEVKLTQEMSVVGDEASRDQLMTSMEKDKENKGDAEVKSEGAETQMEQRGQREMSLDEADAELEAELLVHDNTPNSQEQSNIFEKAFMEEGSQSQEDTKKTKNNGEAEKSEEDPFMQLHTGVQSKLAVSKTGIKTPTLRTFKAPATGNAATGQQNKMLLGGATHNAVRVTGTTRASPGSGSASQSASGSTSVSASSSFRPTLTSTPRVVQTPPNVTAQQKKPLVAPLKPSSMSNRRSEAAFSATASAPPPPRQSRLSTVPSAANRTLANNSAPHMPAKAPAAARSNSNLRRNSDVKTPSLPNTPKVVNKKYANVQSKVGSITDYKPSGGNVEIFSEKKKYNVTSKVGSLEKANHVPGGGNVKVENVKLDFKEKAKSRVEAKTNWEPPKSEKKVITQKLNWNAQSKVGSLEKANHVPGGGNIKIVSQKLEWSAESKVGSLDNAAHMPGGGNVKIFDEKLEFVAAPRVGSRSSNNSNHTSSANVSVL